MRESIGYTVTIRIAIIFIIIVFAFLSAMLVYYKSYKISNNITDIIEKNSGYNEEAKNDITRMLYSIGYTRSKVNCLNKVHDSEAKEDTCSIIENNGEDGYCVYLCVNKKIKGQEQYYYYKVRTNMPIVIPIIGSLPIPIYTNTNEMYNFECKFSKTDTEKSNNCF